MFLLAMINFSHNKSQSVNGNRAKLIKYSYFLTIALIFCNNLFYLFILLEVYTIIFFLYLVGSRFDLQETLYYLQHDLTTYVFNSILSSVFFLTGLYFIIKDFGISALYLDELTALFESGLVYNNNLVNVRGICLILIAIFIKIGLAPFQGWTVRFFKRTCYQSLVYILLISKLILIFGAFFTLFPLISKVSFLSKFVGVIGFCSYVIGSYLVYLRHSESDKFLAHMNLTSSGFFFFLFFIDNAQSCNLAFIYFTTFMILMNLTLLMFYSSISNWFYDERETVDDFEDSFGVNNSFFMSHSVFFNTYDLYFSDFKVDVFHNQLGRLALQSALACLPPAITFFTKIYYDFSFFNKISDVTVPYGLILILSMLTYILTVFGFLSIWRKFHLGHNKLLTFILLKNSLTYVLFGYESQDFTRFFRKFTLPIFFGVGFVFSNFQVI
jgi:hypothetical protein